MKFQILLTTLYYLLFSSSAKQINGTAAVRDTRTPKTTTIYHNGRPVEVLGIPQHHFHTQPLQMASNLASAHVGSPKVKLHRDKIVIKNENNYLQDSYGNRFYGPPQHVAFKTIYPQQFVSLQDLPIHFAQSLQFGPTRAQATYALPQFSFSEASHQPSLLKNEGGFFDFAKAQQSSVPLVLPPQNLNIPLQNHYKIADPTQELLGRHHGPITYTFHKPPPQRFVNFAPDHQVDGASFNVNGQSTNEVASQKKQERENQNAPKNTESRLRPTKQEQVRKKVQKPIVVQKDLSTGNPQYLKPEVFAEPIVPQVQHFLPKVQSVLKYNIDPRPDVPIFASPVDFFQQDNRFDNQIQQIVSRPQNKHKIVINEYTSPEKHELKEEVKAEVIDEEENEENNFYQGYNQAADGFPASEYNEDFEKNIYDEDSYGEPRYHESFTPHSEETFSADPELKRSKYIIKSSVQRDTYGDDEVKDFKPIPYMPFLDAKLHSSSEKKPSGNWSPKAEQKKYRKSSIRSEHKEHDVPYNFTQNIAPKRKRKLPSNSAVHETDYKTYSSSSSERRRPEQQRSQQQKSKALEQPRFVEPQYQYGFEPIIESREMEDLPTNKRSASNVSTNSKVRPTKKNMYKENWYISRSSNTEAESDSR